MVEYNKSIRLRIINYKILASIKYYSYLCKVVHNWIVNSNNDWIGVWCNGNTIDFGSVISGSNPLTPTKRG